MPIDYTRRPKQPEPEPSRPGADGGAGTPGGVSLSKVTLTKAAPSVSLSKQGSAGGVLRVNLNWNARPAAQGGFLDKLRNAAAGPVDLDLGALYEYADGSKGAVQALGGMFDDRRAQPILRLDGDDRSGSSSGGENLHVDLGQAAQIRRVLVYAFIYEGVPNWAAANGVVTLFPASGPQVEVHLDEHDPRSPMCAVALLTSDGRDVTVRREVRYVQGGQQALDEAYGWGMRWRTGRK
ncbi:tellurite resistance protein TerA [Kineococcus xinjiangensis]|uniref:Tellurite resistance protein TerA n=1 Tax=Kineococcus xinjiangensis TaxID=512762 RepID=A0A2S6IFA3_9ACTN|nr:tellurium resistance protein [Kineococcus xinjiangensis]PPK92830.1 tellurite resistance protein TerA [Kineococcus xinjiangensis]